jgi:hypothetical protein
LPGPFEIINLIETLRTADRPWLVAGTAAFMVLVILVWWACLRVSDKWRASSRARAGKSDAAESKPEE